MLLIPDITPAVYQCLEVLGTYAQSLQLMSHWVVLDLVRWSEDFVLAWLKRSELVHSRCCRFGPMNWSDLRIYITLTDPIEIHRTIISINMSSGLLVLICNVSRALCQYILEEYRKMFFRIVQVSPSPLIIIMSNIVGQWSN